MLITTKIGKPITIRYDASGICNGQTIRDSNGKSLPRRGRLGTVEWQVGTIQDLPDTYGKVTFRGYAQASAYTVRISINVQCYSLGAKCTSKGNYNPCAVNAEIPVTVTQ